MKVLVTGGTGFIGKRLVSNLLKAECDVTIATSGRTANPFGNSVRTVTFDRFDVKSVASNVPSTEKFDILFDQLGFGSDDVAELCSLFNGKVKHYVFTSSSAVYEGSKGGFVEGDFDPTSVEPKKGGMKILGYAEGKRSAEAYLFQKAPFSVAAARLPIVLGPDDSTKRFQFHISRIVQEKPIVIPEECGRTNYVWVEDAGRFLCWLGLQHRIGTYNAASSYTLNTNELVRRMGVLLGKTPKVLKDGESSDRTPYLINGDRSVNASKAEKEGFTFTPFDEWFPIIVKQASEN